MSTITAYEDPAGRLADLTALQRQTWAPTDSAAIAAQIQIVSDRLLDDADLRAGWHVLDVGTGTGNAVLAAARLGSYAAGIDDVPHVLALVGERAAAERLMIGLAQADAQALPFDDAEFDAVVSVFGVMYAPDQVAAAAELLRVLRPGGTVALAGWTPTGFIGELFPVTAAHAPPPADMPSPFVWGTEAGLRALLGSGLRDLQLRVGGVSFRGRSPQGLVDSLRRGYGPVAQAFRTAADPAALEADLLELVRRHSRLGPGEGAVAIDAPYLEAIGTGR
jgi:SAM-dependent methyltransferase